MPNDKNSPVQKGLWGRFRHQTPPPFGDLPKPTSDENSGAGLERYKAKLEAWRLHRQHLHEIHIESFKATIGYGSATAKGLFLLDGGALVAMLPMLSSLWRASGMTEAPIADLKVSAFMFVGGLIAAVASPGVSYLAQGEFTDYRFRSGTFGTRLTIALGFMSLMLFIAGALNAVSSFAGGGNFF